MPIYEYRCLDCQKASAFFIRSINHPPDVTCAHCQGQELQRVMSPFALGRSSAPNPEPYSSGPGRADLESYRNPRTIGRHAEHSFQRHGLEMPQLVRNTIQAAREGHLPAGPDGGLER